MVKCAVLLLVVCALLVSESQAWRVRFRGRKLRRYLGDAAKRYIALRVVTAAASAAGKREVGCPEQVTAQEMDQLAAQLQASCLSLGINVGVTGLNRQELDAIFQDNDADGNGVLKGKELAAFSESIQTVQACEAVEEARKRK